MAEKHIGAVGGLFFTTAEIGGVLGPLGIGVLASIHHNFDAALHMLLVICTALIALALLVRQLDNAQLDNRSKSH